MQRNVRDSPCGRGKKKKVSACHIAERGARLRSVWLGRKVAPRLVSAMDREREKEEREREIMGGKRRRSTEIGGLIRAAQSPVRPQPFVVMCHTPADSAPADLASNRLS